MRRVGRIVGQSVKRLDSLARYDTRQAENRRIVRAMDKENKKVEIQ